MLQEEISLRKKIRKVVRSKHMVMGIIEELEKLSREISSLQSCKGHLPFNSQLVNVNVSPADADTEVSHGTESAACGAKRRRKDVEVVVTKPRDKERYLCVSNGIAIFCLDLKQGKSQCFSSAHGIPPLPNISPLNLLKEHCPISVGLFKLGSEVYVFGGDEPALLVDDPNPLWWEDHRNSSCVTHHLSLANGALSLSKCNIGKMKKAKVWPIIDKVDGRIHVFDTIPCEDLFNDAPDWIFSHEILTPDGRWITVPTSKDWYTDCITHHLVAGDRIFAVSNGGYHVFDSKMNTWAAHPRCECPDLFSVKQVWQVLDLGFARCLGEFRSGEPSEPLYVLVAVGMDRSNKSSLAVAYLFNATGQVLCFQRLPYFFDGPVKPWKLFKGTIINVDEEGKTMCALISAHPSKSDSRECLFVYTFTMETVTDRALKIHQQIRGNAKEDSPIEQDFLCVALVDRYIFKTDGECEDDDMIRLRAAQACFL